MADIDNTQDYLDVRDIIDRVETLDAIHDELFDAANDADFTPEVRAENEKRFAEWQAEEGGECSERATLRTLLEELKGNGGDHKWQGDWYPVSLIKDSYFETAMDELLEDIGELKKYEDRPSYITITVDYDALKMDYGSVEYDGETYWYR